MKFEMTVIKDDILSRVSGGAAVLGSPRFVSGDRVYFLGTGTVINWITGTVQDNTGEYAAGQLLYRIRADNGAIYLQPENALTQITVSHEGGASGGW